MDRAPIWSTQQLVEFLAVVGSYSDEESALHRAVERAAESVEAEFGIVRRGEHVLASVGFARADVPAELLAADRAMHGVRTVTGIGACAVLAVPYEDSDPGVLTLARVGDDAFTQDEIGLVGAMAKMLTLSLRGLRLLEAERALRAQSEQRAREALHDSLTGLPNRTLFLDRLGHALARAERERVTVGLLFIDMDRFKDVNDSLGHGSGDELLVAIAKRLDECVRDVDTAARLGGDEFAILLDHVADAREAESVAARVIDAMRQPFPLTDREVFTSASVGIALSEHGTVSSRDLLRYADIAMYRAKAAGRSKAVVFESQMIAAAVERLELEAQLRTAILGGQLLLHFQPIVDLAKWRVHGFEALVRWMHPERGLVPPGDFIPLAEETGLIVPIGQLVLREACAAATRFLRDSGQTLSMSVNVSPRQMQETDLLADVAGALDDAALDPARLVVEITEGVLMQDTEQALRTLTQLRELGVGVAIDDFGTGYSSLSYLQHFPVDRLKVDKSFVDSLGRPGGGVLARATINLAHSLGISTTAEGIEERVQVAELRLLRCELAQGYYFAKPLPFDAAVDFVTAPMAPLARTA
jgi:diguanylate cyclase (GGDEF)-like protein